MVVLLLLACTEATMTVGRPRSTDTGEDTGGDPVDSGVDSGTDSGDTADTGWPDFDCAALPPAEERELKSGGGGKGPRGYHDLVFDDAGHIIGSDTASILIAAYGEDAQALSPGFGWVDGMERLPDGDYAIVDSGRGEIARLTVDGVTSTLATGTLGTYGLAVGPDGMVYAAPVQLTPGPGVIARLDPATGVLEEWAKLPREHTPRVVVFNLDSTMAYIATIGSGAVFQVALDANLDPVSPPSIFVEGVGTWHDGLGIDACGNLYVAEYSTSGLYRITPEGEVESLLRQRLPRYGHGLEWGSGVGGWRMDAMYQPQPYDENTVREVILGVPSGAHFRTWN